MAILNLELDSEAPESARRVALDPLAEQISTPVPLATLWRRLSDGEIRIHEHFYSADRCYVTFEAGPGHPPLPPRALEFVESALLGRSLKVIADDQGVALSTTSAVITLGLRAMGLSGTFSSAPMLCAMAVHAAYGIAEISVARLSRQGTREVVSVTRPDVRLRGRLTPSEEHVARLKLEGFSHAAIAVARRTSIRTIANQLASIFRKLKVSGRSELMCWVIRPDGGATDVTELVRAVPYRMLAP